MKEFYEKSTHVIAYCVLIYKYTCNVYNELSSVFYLLGLFYIKKSDIKTDVR